MHDHGMQIGLEHRDFRRPERGYASNLPGADGSGILGGMDPHARSAGSFSGRCFPGTQRLSPRSLRGRSRRRQLLRFISDAAEAKSAVVLANDSQANLLRKSG